MKPITLQVEDGKDTSWDFDTLEEFFAAYRDPNATSAEFTLQEPGEYSNVSVNFYANISNVSARQKSRDAIEAIFEVFEGAVETCRLPPDETEEALKESLVIFVGHGRNPAWRDLKDHLHDKHGFKVTAYETGPRVGLHIADILETMEDEASFAILVMTAENEGEGGRMHARENVIHEVGLFQGRLGFKRAIVLLEEGCSEFSNLSGVQHIPFAKGNIKETFGEILATIKREFDPSD